MDSSGVYERSYVLQRGKPDVYVERSLRRLDNMTCTLAGESKLTHSALIGVVPVVFAGILNGRAVASHIIKNEHF